MTSGAGLEQTDPEVTHAIEIVAMQVLLNVVDGNVNWEDYPEIPEHDWECVVERVNGLLGNLRVTHADWIAAYALLESRAENV